MGQHKHRVEEGGGGFQFGLANVCVMPVVNPASQLPLKPFGLAAAFYGQQVLVVFHRQPAQQYF